MSSERYEDILKKAQELPADEREKLIRELSCSDSNQKNGDGATLGERMEARGLLGIAHGPADLSTNPKYLEGFGSDGD